MKKFNEFVNEKRIPKYRNRGKCIFPAEHPKVKEVKGVKKDHFTINDLGQGRNALARVEQYKSVPPWYDGDLDSLKNSVKRAVKKEFPSIEVSESVINETNMSHCRFENTYEELQDCYKNMDTIAGKLSDTEKEHREKLIQLCKDIYQEFGYLLPTM